MFFSFLLTIGKKTYVLFFLFKKNKQNKQIGNQQTKDKELLKKNLFFFFSYKYSDCLKITVYNRIIK